MTDVHILIRRFNPSRFSFAWPEIGASFAAIFSLVAEATAMAYAAPYTSRRRQPQVIPDDGLEGRDPNW